MERGGTWCNVYSMSTTPSIKPIRPDQNDQLLTINEVAAHVNVVRKTVYEMFANGLPYGTTNGLPTGNRRVRKQDLDDFMAGKLSPSSRAVAA